MTKGVLDNALLLQSIAGSDGYDDRQIDAPSCQMVPKYADLLIEFQSKKEYDGLRVGILKEGFHIAGMQASTAQCVMGAALKLKDLGMHVEEVSMRLCALSLY